MKNNISLIACDLDGTLLTVDKRLSALTVDTLKKVHEKGIRIVICSGRPLYSVERLFDGVPYDYACCLNGQAVYDHDGHTLMMKNGLNREQIDHLLHLTAQFPVVLNYSIGRNFYHTVSPKCSLLSRFVNWCSRIYQQIVHHNNLFRMMVPFEEVKMDTCEKFCYAGSYRTLKALASRLDPEVYGAVFVSKTWLEIQPAGITKGKALSFVEAYEGIAREQCAAVGDGENDLSMFEAAGHRIAMENGMNALKEKADTIASSNLKDGAARWMIQNLL